MRFARTTSSVRQTFRATSGARQAAIAVASLVLILAGSVGAMPQYRGFVEAFGYKAKEPPKGFSVQLIDSSAPANVLWPGEEASFKFQIVNKTDQPLKAAGHFEFFQFTTRTDPQDVFQQFVFRGKDIGTLPVNAWTSRSKGFVDLVVKAPIPAAFDTRYAAVLELDGQGRQLAAILCADTGCYAGQGAISNLCPGRFATGLCSAV